MKNEKQFISDNWKLKSDKFKSNYQNQKIKTDILSCEIKKGKTDGRKKKIGKSWILKIKAFKKTFECWKSNPKN